MPCVQLELHHTVDLECMYQTKHGKLMLPVHSTFCPACICLLSKRTWVGIASYFVFPF
jgi:hypothetical protein